MTSAQTNEVAARGESFYRQKNLPMAFQPILAGLVIFMLLSSSCSSPHKIVLKDGHELIAMNNPRYVEKTGYYRYRALNGKDALVQRDEVLQILEQ